jgi:hypothetical protein
MIVRLRRVIICKRRGVQLLRNVVYLISDVSSEFLGRFQGPLHKS